MSAVNRDVLEELKSNSKINQNQIEEKLKVPEQETKIKAKNPSSWIKSLANH